MSLRAAFAHIASPLALTFRPARAAGFHARLRAWNTMSIVRPFVQAVVAIAASALVWDGAS